MEIENNEKQMAVYGNETIKINEMFFNPVAFEFAQRVAKVFATSDLVPAHFKGNLSNILIAMNYAARLRADVFMVLQNMYVVHGRPGVEAKLVIALINQSGKYAEPLKYKFDGEKDEYGCTAWTREAKSGEVVEGPKVSWKMVKAEQWDQKSGTKWKTIPDLMFRYRAASWFANVHCPELKLGMQTVEEINDYVELRQTSKGKYAAAPVEVVDNGQALPFDEVFAAELADPLFAEWFDELVDGAACHWKKTKDEARSDSIKQHEQIKALFKNYLRKLASNPETSPTANGADIKAHAETSADTKSPEEQFRASWINLKEAGFSTFVFKNIDKFRELQGDALKEAEAKWHKIYPTFSCPFVAKKPAEDAKEATGEAQGEALKPAGEGTATDPMENELVRLRAELKLHSSAHKDVVEQAKRDTGIAAPQSIDGYRVLLEAVEAILKERK